LSTAAICFIRITEAVDLQNVSCRRFCSLNASSTCARIIGRIIATSRRRSIIGRVFFNDHNVIAAITGSSVIATTGRNDRVFRDTKVTSIIIATG